MDRWGWLMPGPLRTFTPSAPATTYGAAGVAVAGIAVGSGVVVDDGVFVREGAGVSVEVGGLGGVGDGRAVSVGRTVACADTGTGDGVPAIWSSSSVHAKPYQVSPIPSPTRSSHPATHNVVRPRPCRGYKFTFTDGPLISRFFCHRAGAAHALACKPGNAQPLQPSPQVSVVGSPSPGWRQDRSLPRLYRQRPTGASRAEAAVYRFARAGETTS